MAGQITVQGTKAILRAFLGKETDQIPDNLWIALILTEPPTIASAGDDIDEVDSSLYPSYQRAQYPNNATNWQLSGSDTIFNSSAIEFPIADEDWGEITYFGVCSEKAGGKLLAYGELSSSQDVIEGDHVQIDIGGISFSIYNPAYEGD